MASHKQIAPKTRTVTRPVRTARRLTKAEKVAAAPPAALPHAPEAEGFSDVRQVEASVTIFANTIEMLSKEGITNWNALNAMAVVVGRSISVLFKPEQTQEAYSHLAGLILQEARAANIKKMVAEAKAG